MAEIVEVKAFLYHGIVFRNMGDARAAQANDLVEEWLRPHHEGGPDRLVLFGAIAAAFHANPLRAKELADIIGAPEAP